MRKHERNLRIEGHSIKYLPSSLKNSQDHEKQGKTKKYYSMEDTNALYLM